jgi:exosome complex RNA-binding protein Rrp4
MSNPEWNTSIVIGYNGHVWVAKHTVHEGKYLYMSNARIIRQWGTDKGLNQLIDGPTGSTVLDDMAPTVILLEHACMAIIPCREDKWAAHL